MESFAKDLLLDNNLFEIHFNKINTPNRIKYFVFAKGQNGDNYFFNMESEGTGWRIVNAPGVSDLFLKNEGKLSDIINEQLEK
jgi:hypothetical protein